MASSNKGGFDPGWNDPPTFTYEKATTIQANAAKKESKGLNKRVAFPMTGNHLKSDAIDPTAPISNLTPGAPPLNIPSGTPPSAMINPPSTNLTPVTDASDIDAITSKLNKVLANLDVANCDEQIKKRINIMERMWLENKLDMNVQSRLCELSEAIRKNDTEVADHIHKGLMVDYGAQCVQWMSAVRHIINAKREGGTSE